jgi:chromosome partitioning protein
VITGKAAVSEAVIETEFKNMSLVPSSNALAGAEMEIFSLENRMSRLRAYIREVKEDYDYILIDCPPALGLLTLNALAASDKLIVPMVAEFYALEGLSQFINTFRAIKKGFNPDLDILGILFVMYDNRMNLSKQVVEEVEKYFPNKIFAARIPRNIRLAEAPSYGRPVLYYDRRSSGAMKYMELAQEITGEKFPQVVKAKLKKVTSTEGASKE